MNIGIIIGSIRAGRKGEAVGRWTHDLAGQRDDANYQLIDLKEFDVPLLMSATVPGSANKQYDSARTTAWSRAIDACEAFVFVTPEYNHGVPGGFKNAYDSLGNEWQGKPVGFVSYGSVGGIRAVESWRQVVANFQQFGVRAQVSLSTFTDWKDGEFAPADRHDGDLSTLLDQLVAVTGKLRG